jgi:hypothetical protein
MLTFANIRAHLLSLLNEELKTAESPEKQAFFANERVTFPPFLDQNLVFHSNNPNGSILPFDQTGHPNRNDIQIVYFCQVSQSDCSDHSEFARIEAAG